MPCLLERCEAACHPAACKSHFTAEEDASRILHPGSATGQILHSSEPLSFWGGIDTTTGVIIDAHHPLVGENVKERVLTIPGSRGSCSGSMALLELLVAGVGPAAILLERMDAILALGAIVSQQMFGIGVAVIVLGPRNFERLAVGGEAVIHTDRGVLEVRSPGRINRITLVQPPTSPLTLLQHDQAVLEGKCGSGQQTAMEIIAAVGAIYGSIELVNIKRSHIDSCIYTGPASLLFARHFAERGAKFSVPTTLNSVSIDRRWASPLDEAGTGIDDLNASRSRELAETYLTMGAASDSLTCAPYLLEEPPTLGDQIAWGESNAVVFANSVLGARTQKYPDLLDVCIAICGKAPLAGPHILRNRRPRVMFTVAPNLAQVDDQLIWPLLGYHIGALAHSRIPILCGLEEKQPRQSDLKAFGAAFATTSSAPMFHIRGITPEAASFEVDSPAWQAQSVHISLLDLRGTWSKLNSSPDHPSQRILVALGNPHFTLDEFAQLADLVVGRRKHPTVKIYVTCGQYVQSQAAAANMIQPLVDFGVELINDTCWCMIGSSIIGGSVNTIVTNSAKYAHYGPGMVKKTFYFGNLSGCVDAAVNGGCKLVVPSWLSAP